jgi:hypothetical protein
MKVKRVVFTVLVASVVLLAVGIGPGAGHSVRALPEPGVEPAGGTIPYAGRLSDQAGKPVVDGAYDLSFTLYDSLSGGNPLWLEVQRGVTLSTGEFLTTLGSVEPIPATVLGGQDRWLAVSVRGPGEAGFTALAPRQRVSAAAPTAATAGSACPHDHLGEWWTGDPGTGNNGLRVESTRADSVGLTGVAHNGTNATGVFGWTTQGTGVQGSSDSSVGVRGTSNSGTGVYGRSTDGTGVYGRSDTQVGVFGEGPSFGVYSKGDAKVEGNLAVTGSASGHGDLVVDGEFGDVFAPGLLRMWSNRSAFILLDANNDSVDVFQIFNGAGWGVFQVNESGDTVATGTKSALVETPNHGPRLVYAVESPQVRIEDFGTASLVNGKVIVPIEPVFAETVNLELDYLVFLTPLGDCNGLYVAAKTSTSFEVRELGGGTASIGFDYRIVATRRGYENTRLESPDLPASPDGR